MSRFVAITVAALSCAPAFAVSPQYSVTNLTPPGYLEGFFLGAGGDQAVGWGDFALPAPNPEDFRDVHAFVWNQSTQTMTDLDPGADSFATYAAGAFGGYQVGEYFGTSSAGPINSAAIWHGTADSMVLLNSPGTKSSYAFANSATNQVGNATPTGSTQSVPYVWAGSAASGHALSVPTDFVDPGYGGGASGISGQRIIGTASDPVGFNAAIYWSSPDAEAKVLRPADYDETFGDAIHGNHALVEAAGAIGRHLFLYNLDDDKSVDLHPSAPGVLYSYGTAMTDTEQVGFVAVADPNDPGNRFEHAAAWFGTAASFIDLHAQLPADYSSYLYSRATGIDDYGNIYGYVYNVPTGPYVAVRWSLAPEPATLGSLALLSVIARRRRSR